MIKAIKQKLILMSAILTIAAPLAVGGLASAQQYNGQTSLNTYGCNGSTASSSGNCAGAQGSLNTLITNILNVFSWVVGIVAVLMIIIAGFRYIVSGGESGGVTGAKNAILFAIVGIVIVAIAQIVVQFVLTKASSTSVTSN